MLRVIEKFLGRLEGIVMVLIMSIATLLTMTQVVCRYVFNITLFWAEEVVIYSIIWMSFVAASMGVHLRAHICVDVLNRIVPPAANKWLLIITSLLGITFSGYLTYYGYKLFSVTLDRGMLSPALRIPMAWIYLPIWVTGLLMGFRYISMLLESLRQTSPKEAEFVSSDKEELT